ncbi:MAG: zeta toxin family protein [Bacteroidales bacterium]
MDINDIIRSITNYDYSELNKIAPPNNNLEAVIKQSLLNGVPSNTPTLINVSGIPGSGKSTYCNKLLSQPEYKNYIFIGFDSIMENPLTPYKEQEAVDAIKAFSNWELPARIAGYELLKRAIDNRYSIIFEHSSSIKQHIELFKYLISQQGYYVDFIYLEIDIETAKERAAKRKRYLPTEYLTDRLTVLAELLPEYQKICTTFKKLDPCQQEL